VKRLFQSSCALILLFTGSVSYAATWCEAQLGEFHIVSELDRNQTAGVLRDIENYRVALQKVFSASDIEPHMRVTVFLLRKWTWSQYITDQKHLAGVTFPGDDQMYVAVDGSSWMQAAPIVFHELTHVFLHKNFRSVSIPVWWDEGYADFMSTVATSKNTIKVGLPAVWRYYSMQQLGWMPLQEMLAVSRSSPAYSKEKLAEAFYAQSWLMIHSSIFGDPVRSKQIDAYMRAVAVGVKPEQAFTKAFPGDHGEFEAELKHYSRGTAFHYLSYPVPELAKKSVDSVVPMAPSAAADELAEWMMSYSRLDPDDMKFLEGRVAQESNNALAAVQLARAYLRKERVADAKLLLNSNCSAPGSYLHALNCGKGLLDAAKAESVTDMEPVTLRARSFFLHALQTNPDDLSALIEANNTYGDVAGDPAVVIAGLERVLSRDTNNPVVSFNLAQAYSSSDLRKSKMYLEKAIIYTFDSARTNPMIQWLRQIDEALAEEAKAGRATAH
jgi:tetratricopeptide (TPR) repeat protein